MVFVFNSDLVHTEITRSANWTDSISGGFAKTEGTTTLNAILQLQRRSPKHRVRMCSILFIEEEDDFETRKRETIEENFNSDAQYDYFLKKVVLIQRDQL